MKSALAAAALLAACSNSTAGGLLAIPFSAAGPAWADGGPLRFTTAAGWNVELDAASIELGPFYFNIDPPNTTEYRSGVVIVESLEQVSLDLLQPSFVTLDAGATGETGLAGAGEIDLLPAGWTEANATVTGPIASFTGVATPSGSGTTPVPFSGSISVDPALASSSTPIEWLQRVSGALCNLDFDGRGALTLRVDPSTWFDTADFSALVTGLADAGSYGWQTSSDFNDAVLGQIQATTGVYAFQLSGS